MKNKVDTVVLSARQIKNIIIVYFNERDAKKDLEASLSCIQLIAFVVISTSFIFEFFRYVFLGG